jgi:hypothetical protein
MDTQVLELLGRNYLVAELLRAGLEVGLPIRDRGVDLIAYADLNERVSTFIARPIQMKAASTSSFSIEAKYARFPDLILAHVWFLNDPRDTMVYALTYAEALTIANEIGWTNTESWRRGYYVTTRPSVRLVSLLEPHRMTPERWWLMVAGGASRRSP